MWRRVVWAPDFKLWEREKLIHLLSMKDSTPLEIRRVLSKPDGLLILSTEESPVLID